MKLSPIRATSAGAWKRSLLVGIIVAVATLGSFGTASAADCGPDGTKPNSSGSCETAQNEVRCGQGTDTGLLIVSASATGAEVCNEGGTDFPVEGRAGTQQDCQCVYIDGDDDNNHGLLLHGWLRVDQTGAYCRSDNTAPGEQSYTGEGRPAQDCFI